MNRKELIRAYKENKQPMGVYRVRNKVNGKALIGTSTNLPAILNRNLSELRTGGHRIHSLQKDWNELGAEAFEFEVLDHLKAPDDPNYNPTADLRELEQLWLEKLAPVDLYRH